MRPLQLRVYLEDTDAGGIVYHASYLRFLERARTESLRAAGLEQSQTFQLDVSFVVHIMKLEFRRPALLDAQLEVSCELKECSGARLNFEQQVRDMVSGVIYCAAEVTVACVALSSQRPRRVPKAVLAALTEAT